MVVPVAYSVRTIHQKNCAAEIYSLRRFEHADSVQGQFQSALFSAGQGDMRDYFTKTLGVPTLYIESDLEDPRYFSEAQLKNRIDAYFEALEHRLTPERT